MAARPTYTLTPMQQAYLDALFGECLGDTGCALKAAGYAKGTRARDVEEALQDEIIARANREMVQSAPRAVLALRGVLTDPTAMGAKNMLAASKEILDRVGIVKKDQLEVKTDGTAIVILPTKRDD